jgi:8-oxo-dGTP diphosphatase
MSDLNQFGVRLRDRDYRARSGAYGLLMRDGRLACVRIGFEAFKYDLPGGGIDPGETPEQAVRREFGEETGLAVEVVRPVTDFRHYFIHEDGTAYNNHSHFFEVRLIGDSPDAQCEADHELVWLEPMQALLSLDKEGYAWAVILWLRGQASQA